MFRTVAHVGPEGRSVARDRGIAPSRGDFFGVDGLARDPERALRLLEAGYSLRLGLLGRRDLEGVGDDDGARELLLRLWERLAVIGGPTTRSPGGSSRPRLGLRQSSMPPST
jgi:hypothetical protein